MWRHELEELEKQVSEDSYTRDSVPNLVRAVRAAWDNIGALRVHIGNGLKVFRSFCEALDQYVPSHDGRRAILPIERIHILGQRALDAEKRIKELEEQLAAREIQEVPL